MGTADLNRGWRKVVRVITGPRLLILLVVLLLASLYLMIGAARDSTLFSNYYSSLLVANIVALVLLSVLILYQLQQMISQYRRHAAGSRMKLRLVVLFTILSIAPVSVMYYFSLEFIHRGVDSWFDATIEEALQNSLELSRASLNVRMRELLHTTGKLADELVGVENRSLALLLNDLRERSGAEELALFAISGRPIASSHKNLNHLTASRPNEAILMQLRRGESYVGLEPFDESRTRIRVVLNLPGTLWLQDARLLQALYTVPPRVSTLAENVQQAYTKYTELSFLRKPLKYSFTITLSLVLLLTMLTAVWAAFMYAHRLVAPIRDLVRGTRAVATGDYERRLPVRSHDEFGHLARSFNEMTQRLAQARDEAQRSQQHIETQRAYLEAILKRLSSGVLTVGMDGILHTANPAAAAILDVPLEELVGGTLESVAQRHPHLAPLAAVLLPHISIQEDDEWREEVVLFGDSGRQILLCRATVLRRKGDMQHDQVIVFDDITSQIRSQRDAAWSEVARRLAHEIKNPLTPIQLSAERMRRRYLDSLPEEEAGLLDRSTHTIVQQVEALKEMVKAFSDYARSPELHLRPLDFNQLIGEVVDLYRVGEGETAFQLDLEEGIPPVDADAGRMRQLLNNLIKNAQETVAGREGARIMLRTRWHDEQDGRFVELRVEDNGPGIPEEVMAHLFEPYITTKPKGTGLGLAVVKKIVEEHNGVIYAENLPSGGAGFVIRLPGSQRSFSAEVRERRA
ncbi:MAG TPA: HAMP domain-containing protein [Gammaproteobacteria bacterium]|nr:HAMP domain-containing protein [Gammaproteobacteria bacterium]